MPPRPIHRWKTFWLGLFVLAFLGWAWARSLKHQDGLNATILGMESTLWFDQWGGSISLSLFHDGLSDTTGAHTTHDPLDSPIVFPAAIEHLELPVDLYRPAVDRYSIAHWFLILLFLLPWLAFLAWRWRRMKPRPADLPSQDRP
jgi:hypothetical protein